MRIFGVWILTAVITFGLLVGPQALAAKTVDERLEELEREIQLLKRQKEVEKEIQIKKDTETPVLKVSKDGFNVSSKDQAFILKFRGQVQTDHRYFIDDNASGGSNTFLLRRVRPTLEGTVYKYFDFRVMPEFGGGAGANTSIQDAWVDFKYWKAAQLRVGKFKSPIGIERLQADAAGQFIETALSTNLVPNRDLGVDLHGEFFEGALTYDAGVFNGSADNGSGTSDADIHDDKEFVARIFSLPFKNTNNDYLNGLGVGLGGSVGSNHGSTLPTYRSGGQQTIFGYTPASGTVRALGDRIRIAPQAYYYLGPFGILSEFVLTSQEVQKGAADAKIDNSGFQVAATYVLTGENASYTGVIPRYDFDPRNGKWGAFELATRFSALTIDPDAFPTFASPLTSVEDATAWTVGLNWYLNKNLKFMTHFEETFFNGGAANTGNRKNEHALLSRLQIYF
jgi:phosphate-selective porin OprO and OprP